MTTAALKTNSSHWTLENRPTEKLKEEGVNSLTDVELLSILIGSGTPQLSATEIARKILCQFENNLNAMGKARMDELTNVEGVGNITACRIMATVELGRRRQLATARELKSIDSAIAVYNYMLPQLMDLDNEEFHVLLLNNGLKLIKSVKISQGGLTETIVDVRIIMREALLANATVMILCHNHPSGNIRPSKYDDQLTQQIKKACDTMRITLFDHVIVTDGRYYSFHGEGRL